MKREKWIPHAKGECGKSFEISIVREGSFGTITWGWGGNEKIILNYYDNPRADMTEQDRFNARIAYAKEYANWMNKRELELYQFKACRKELDT